MTWREQLRDASFRGVPFQVESGDVQHGRRTVLHEFPLRDKPFVEDLGRRARLVSVEAFIVGPDFMAGRDALIAAIEQPGGGKLVHPHYGEMQVTLTEPARVSNSTREGGMCRISLVFTEAGEITYPSAAADTRAQVATRADAAIAAGTEAFDARFTLDDLPGWLGTDALDVVGKALDRVQAAAQLAGGIAANRAGFDALLGGLRDQVADLLNEPLSLARNVFELVGAVRALAPDGLAAQRPLLAIAGFGDELAAVPVPTPSRRAQAENQAALVELVATTGAVEAARASASIAFESYDQALDVRDQVLTAIDAVRDASPSDTLYVALTDLHVAVVRDIAARGADLARQVTYTPPATVPALVIAYALYEDLGREADLIARNAIVRPGFVPGGQLLEVLSDA